MNNIRTPSEKKRKSFICDYPARRSSLTFGNIKRTIRLIPTNSFGSNTTYLNLNPKIKMVQSERRTSLFKLRKIKSIRELSRNDNMNSLSKHFTNEYAYVCYTLCFINVYIIYNT